VYHLFELHNSDGNDNFITDVIVAAETKDAAFEAIDKSIELPFEDSGLGDDTLAICEHWAYYDDYGNELSADDDVAEDNEGICYSGLYYWRSSHDTLEAAEAECGRYHGGPTYLEAEEETEGESDV